MSRRRSTPPPITSDTWRALEPMPFDLWSEYCAAVAGVTEPTPPGEWGSVRMQGGWRNDPITERQRAYLVKRNEKVPPTKGEAADLINTIVDSTTTPAPPSPLDMIRDVDRKRHYRKLKGDWM